MPACAGKANYQIRGTSWAGCAKEGCTAVLFIAAESCLMVGKGKTAAQARPSYLSKSMNVAHGTPAVEEADDCPQTVRLEETFVRFQAELLGTLYYLVGNMEDARDALQETFVKCWRHRDGLAEIENLKAWIFQIALNTGRDLRSSAWRRRRQALPDGEPMPDTDTSPQADLEHREQLARLRDAVRDLRPEEQEVFLLRQNGGLTYEQIAAAINIPPGTVKTRMRLALGKLRTVLATE
jgi:RNA polymerase sigma-70 factor (ECF subfamily)